MDEAEHNRGHAAHLRTGDTSEASAKALPDEYVLSVKHSLVVLRRRLWVILLVAVVLAVSTMGFGYLQTPTYEASIKILLRQQQQDEAPPSLANDVLGLQEITETMAEAVHTRPVAEAVIRKLDLGLSPEEFLEKLSAEQIGGTEFIEVSYRDSSPERAQRIANVTGEVFSEQASEVSPSATPITATVWEEAAVPNSPVTPNPLRDGALALMLGGVLGIGLAFLLERLDDSLHSPEQVERASGVPTLGVLPRAQSNDLSGRLMINRDPASAGYQTYRTLRTILIHSLPDISPKVILLTSPGIQEGKSTVCANLGVALARVGKRTLILDCDFRDAAIHKFFEQSKDYGMVEALSGERGLREVWQEPLPELKVVTGGYISRNPAGSLVDDLPELLASNRFADLLGQLRGEFDYVLIDAAPTEVVADSAILAARVDGVLLVLDPQKTGKSGLQRAVHNLESTGARILGTVMTDAKVSSRVPAVSTLWSLANDAVRGWNSELNRRKRNARS